MADETVSVAFDVEPADAHASAFEGAAERAEEFAEATDRVEESLSSAGKSAKQWRKTLVDALKRADRAAEKTEDSLEDVADASEEVDDGFSVAAGSVGTFVGSLASEAVTAITDKIKELAVEVAEFAIESTRARRGAKGLLAQFAKDEGAAKTLFAAMAKQAETLGVSVKDVTEQWVDFRKKGASATEAIKLTALRADVLKVTESTEEADRATEAYFKAIEKGATSSEALKKVSEDFRVSGDGANAAAAKVHTFEGQLQNIKNTFAKAFGKAIEKAGPQLTRVAEGIAKITEKAIESGAVEDTVMAVVKALDFLVENWETISNVVSAAWEVFKRVDPLVSLVRAINNVVEAWGPFKEGVKSAVKAISEAIDTVKETVSDWISVGGDLVDGFVKGIKDGVKDAIAAVSDLGDQAMSALKSKLKIGSPSKVFAEMGVNVSEGFAAGVEPVDVAEKLIATDGAVPPIAPANGNAPAAPSIEVVVNFGSTTADAADIELTLRRAINDALIGYRQSVGAA